MVSATNLAEALAIEAAGIDFIIAQGIEAGGHRGIFNQNIDSGIKTTDLLRLITENCKIPVIAAGGIMNGFQAQYLLNLGAAAVQLGTAFVQCKSSSANPAYRKALFENPITQITSSISGRPARGILNDWMKLVDTEKLSPIFMVGFILNSPPNQVALQVLHHGHSYVWLFLQSISFGQFEL